MKQLFLWEQTPPKDDFAPAQKTLHRGAANLKRPGFSVTRAVILLLAIASFSTAGCTSSRIYLPVRTCQATVDQLQAVLDLHVNADAQRFVKGFATYDDFRERFAKDDLIDSPPSSENPFGSVTRRIVGYTKTDAEMRSEYASILRQTVIDPNDLVAALPHITLKKGQELDYLCPYDAGTGPPILYVRSTADRSYTNWAAITNLFIEDGLDFLSGFQTDGSDMSYFEFALLSLHGDNFYLSGHADEFARVVCTMDALEKWVAGRTRCSACQKECHHWEWQIPPAEAVRRMREIDLRPYVEHLGKKVLVSIVTICPRSGLTRYRITFNEALAEEPIDIEAKGLLTWRSPGMM